MDTDELEQFLLNILLPHMDSASAMHAAQVLSVSGKVGAVLEDAGDIL